MSSHFSQNVKLTRRALAAAIMLIMASVSPSFSEGPSVTVYPSEDELLEALRLGEIDYPQYLILQDIIVHGIDSASIHLFDEIPNLSFFMMHPKSLTTSLEKEQKTGFSRPVPTSGRPVGTLVYKYHQELQQEARTQYRGSGRFCLNDHFEVAFKLHREYSGRERFVGRQLIYKDSRGPLRELVLGNFSRRLAAGTILGYRGKLLGSSDRLDAESLLFPDYGGYNGLYTRVKFDCTETETLASVSRDRDHTLISAGGMFSLTKSPFRPGVIMAVSRLKNRGTGKRLYDVKYGLSGWYRYGDSYVSLEMCRRVSQQSLWGGVVVEGRHRFRGAEVRFAGWGYADDYIDLTGGSKAANLHRAATLEPVDFSYSEKRSGQAGAMLKSIVLLAGNIEVINSILYAGRNTDTANVEFLFGIVKKHNRGCEIRLDYLNKARKHAHGEVDQRMRFETRILTGNLSAKCYIAYNTKSSRCDYASVFVNVRYRSSKVGSIEMWSNLARFDLRDAVIDYWYAYVKNEQRLSAGVTTAMKLSHSYSRSEDNRTVILLELEVAI